jgi:hypothetical protein
MPRSFRPVPRLVAALCLSLAPVTGAGASGDAPAEEADAAPVFVPIEGLQVPIIEAGAMSGRLRVEIVLQGVSSAVLPDLRRELPRFRERALTAALEYARLHASPYAAVNVAELSATLEAALKDPVLKRVLIVQVRAEPA